MKYIISLLLICICTIPYTYAISEKSQIKTMIENIGISLNHQDFIGAQEMFQDLKKATTDDILIRETSYGDFLTVIQSLNWQGEYTLADTYIQKRIKIYPNEKNNASLLTRKNGVVFSKTCRAKTPTLTDLLDQGYCYRFNTTLNEKQKKNLIKKIIVLGRKEIEKDGENLQNISDFGNFLSEFLSTFPYDTDVIGDKAKYKQEIRSLGKQVITKDPHWVNGYFLILSSYDTKKNRLDIDATIEQLRINYIGDKDRWQEVVDSFIQYYQ